MFRRGLQLFDLLAQAMFRQIYVGFLKVAHDLAHHVVDAGFAEVARDDVSGIGFRLVALLAEQLGRPESDQLVTPDLYPKLQFLIVLELFLEGLLTVGKAHVGILPLCLRAIAIAAARPQVLSREPYSSLERQGEQHRSPFRRCALSFYFGAPARSGRSCWPPIAMKWRIARGGHPDVTGPIALTSLPARTCCPGEAGWDSMITGWWQQS